jgi:hypothetical protein
VARGDAACGGLRNGLLNPAKWRIDRLGWRRWAGVVSAMADSTPGFTSVK